MTSLARRLARRDVFGSALWLGVFGSAFGSAVRAAMFGEGFAALTPNSNIEHCPCRGHYKLPPCLVIDALFSRIREEQMTAKYIITNAASATTLPALAEMVQHLAKLTIQQGNEITRLKKEVAMKK